jgi:AcrR family transcriptional regulator
MEPPPEGPMGWLAGLAQQRAARSRWAEPLMQDEGLRARKKRLMRQLISDTATAMFLERGFDSVRVAEVAQACGVSEKTVFNYFPTKEQLLLDREEDFAGAIRRALSWPRPGQSIVDATVEAVIAGLMPFLIDDADRDGPIAEQFVRFTTLLTSTPALRAANLDMMDRLTQVAAETLAERIGVSPSDPEPQVAATALMSLWTIAFRLVSEHARAGTPRSRAHDAIVSQVRRAARLIDTGLWCFDAVPEAGAVAGERSQLQAAAEAANEARKQVVAAIRQAREAWRLVQQAAGSLDRGTPSTRRAAASDDKDEATTAASPHSIGSDYGHPSPKGRSGRGVERRPR